MTPAEQARWRAYIEDRTEVDPATGCWVWQQSRDWQGYGQSHASRRAGHGQLAHRLAYLAFVGPIPDGQVVRHQCHNQACCNPDPKHMQVGTHKDNKEDDKRAGRKAGRLSHAKAAEIRSLLAQGKTQQKVAELFGVVPRTIDDIVRGKTWAASKE